MSSYEVVTTENGREGLKILNEFKPDLILLDIVMPVMDGKEFLEVKRVNIKLKDIPVLLLTCVTDAEEIKDCLELGALDCVLKTTHPVDLLNKIESVLEGDIEDVQDTVDQSQEQILNVKNLNE